MFYKKVFTIINLSFTGAAFLLLIIGVFNFGYSLWMGTISILLAFLSVIVLVIPDLLGYVRKTAISVFGSREEKDILAHFSDVYFAEIFAGHISAQLDLNSESQMTGFADSLKNMFGKDVVPGLEGFYPEVSEEQWNSYLDLLGDAGKDAMRYVFFPETRGNPDSAQIAQKLKEEYPFMTGVTLRGLIGWWQVFKSRMEQQNRADGI